MVSSKSQCHYHNTYEPCFQCALLYTTSDTGQRRIRVHTLSLPTTSAMGSIYRSADLDSQMMVILGGLEDAKEAKEEATKACVPTASSCPAPPRPWMTHRQLGHPISRAPGQALKIVK